MLSAEPVWLRVIYEDDAYRFVLRDYGHAQYRPGFFVEDRGRGRRLELLRITTEHARLGRSPSDIDLPVGWDFGRFAGRDYVDMPLQDGFITFPDRITRDAERRLYRLDYQSELNREQSLTTLWIRVSDLERVR